MFLLTYNALPPCPPLTFPVSHSLYIHWCTVSAPITAISTSPNHLNLSFLIIRLLGANSTKLWELWQHECYLCWASGRSLASPISCMRTAELNRVCCEHHIYYIDIFTINDNTRMTESLDVTSENTVRFLQRTQCSHCKRCISYSNSVCLSVCPSHAGIVSKRRHVARCSLQSWIAKCV